MKLRQAERLCTIMEDIPVISFCRVIMKHRGILIGPTYSVLYAVKGEQYMRDNYQKTIMHIDSLKGRL